MGKHSGKKAAKLHVEITPSNWTNIEEYIKLYNEDQSRVTPKIKPAHVINAALNSYLKKRTGKEL
jgi:hypothetical protein